MSFGSRGRTASQLPLSGALSSSTMMVIAIAITASLNASRRPLLMDPPAPSFRREQVLQVGAREGAGESVLTQDVAGERGLALLQLPDLLLQRAQRQQPVGDDGAGLADAVRPVDGLRLHRRVPPRVEEHDVAGRGQVEAGPAGLEGDEENARTL